MNIIKIKSCNALINSIKCAMNGKKKKYWTYFYQGWVLITRFSNPVKRSAFQD